MTVEDKINALKIVADDLPVPIIVHLLPIYEVVYMNKVGLDILGVDMEELLSIDPSTYVARYFNQEDDNDHAEKIRERLDKFSEKHTSYFQQVKSKDGVWEVYASNTKVFYKNHKGEATHIVTTASPLEPQHHITVKIDRLMDDVRFLRDKSEVFALLSSREKQLLKLMAMGLSSVQIAEQLFIAMATVDTHRRNIRKKLGLKNNYDAVRFAHAFNLI